MEEGVAIGTQESMTVGMYAFNCRDAAALAGFWAEVLERSVDEGATAGYASIGFGDDGPTWMFHRPMTGGPASGDNRLMLDLSPGESWRQQADRVEALGAERAGDYDAGFAAWVEFRDPEGNMFRFVAPRPG